MNDYLSKLKQNLMPEPQATARAAVLLPLIPTEQGLCLLLEVRSQTMRQPGEICLPGGHTETGETAAETALRETEEELSLPRTGFEVLGYLKPFAKISGEARVLPVAALAEESILEDLEIDETEVADAFLVPLEWLKENPPRSWSWNPADPDPNLPPALRQYLQNYGVPIQTMCWEYEGYAIWGLTARIIYDFIN